jgi:HPt (histidine-containing phosphotransfer) domain-containing protein
MTESPPLAITSAEKHIELLLNKTKNNRGLALIIFNKLFAELPVQLVDISTAINQQQLATAKDVVHILHGSVSFCGFIDLQGAAKNLEICLLNNDQKAAQQQFNELQLSITELLSQRQEILTLLS